MRHVAPIGTTPSMPTNVECTSQSTRGKHDHNKWVVAIRPNSLECTLMRHLQQRYRLEKANLVDGDSYLRPLILRTQTSYEPIYQCERLLNPYC